MPKSSLSVRKRGFSISALFLLMCFSLVPVSAYAKTFDEWYAEGWDAGCEDSTNEFAQYTEGKNTPFTKGYNVGYIECSTSNASNITLIKNLTDDNASPAESVPPTRSENATRSLDAFQSREFDAALSGSNVVPPVNTSASASAHFELKNEDDELTFSSFSLEGRKLLGIVAVHIHSGNSTENGPIVLTLRNASQYGNGVDSWEQQLISSGPIKPEDFEGPLRGKTMADLINLIDEGKAYVDIHTTTRLIPELRGTVSPTVDNTLSEVTNSQNYGDLREQGYNNGCSDALNGILSSSLSEQSNTYRLGYKEGYDACSGEIPLPTEETTSSSLPLTPSQQPYYSPPSSYSTPAPRINWGEICRNPVVDALIVEQCDTLVTAGGYELTEQGKRVLGCVLGGGVLGTVALQLGIDPLTIMGALGPAGEAVGCGSNRGQTDDPLGDTLSGLLGSSDRKGSENNPLGDILQSLLGNR